MRFRAGAHVLLASTLFSLTARAAPGAEDLAALVAKSPKPEVVTLKNGLTVLVERSTRVPNVAVVLRFRAGAKDANANEEGVALFAAHAFTEGGRHFRHGDYDRFLDDAGSSKRSVASEADSTTYSMTVPKAALATPLWLWSDAMAWGADALSEEELLRVRSRLAAERKVAFEQAPSQCAFRVRDHALFPEGHPYHDAWEVSPEAIERADPSSVRSYVRRYFTPENAILSFVGDVTSTGAVALATQYFGDIPRGDGPAPTTAGSLPTPDHERRIDMVARTDHAKVILSWLTPPFKAVGDAEFDILANTWGGTTRKELVDWLLGSAPLASGVWARQSSHQLASFFYVAIDGKPGVSGDAIVRAFDEWLQSRFVLSEEAVERVERAWVGGKILDADDPLTRSRRYGAELSTTGRTDFLADDLLRFHSSKARVAAAWDAYLTEGRRVTVVVSPSKTASVCGELAVPAAEEGAR